MSLASSTAAPAPPLAGDASDRIRLMKVVPTFMCGGTENQFMTLGRSLDADRFDLSFACLRRLGGFVQEIDERGIPLFECDVRTFRSVKALGQQVRLARHMASNRIDIVHTYSFYGNVFAIPSARMARVPVVIASIRDRAPYLTPTQKRAQRWVCQLADRILVNAHAVKDWLIGERYDASKIVVIPNGVDLSRFVRTPRSTRALADLGLHGDQPIVAVISRLNPLKGLEQFLEATATIARRFPEARFLVVGDTNPDERHYWSVLTACAERMGVAERVRFAGLRTDVPEILAGVSVSVMPSHDEALSNVVLESMAAGAPLVATRVGGTPEVVQDGVNGLLVPPADAAALADAVCRLLADPDEARRMGARARHSIVERFSIDRMVRSTEALYTSLLNHQALAPTHAAAEAAGK